MGSDLENFSFINSIGIRLAKLKYFIYREEGLIPRPESKEDEP